jgi:hypothetical protein
MAKEILKRGDPPKRYKTELFYALLSTLVPIGWELILGDRSAWLVVAGWVLGLIPLVLWFHIFWIWAGDRSTSSLKRGAAISLVLLLFSGSAAYSIRDSFRPTFLFVWPGFPWDGGRRQYYYVAERKSLSNADVLVLDANQVGNQIGFHIPEIDHRKGGVPSSFFFTPSRLGHEKLQIVTQAKEVDTYEELTVSTRGPNLFPAFRAVVSKNGKTIFACQDRDFPEKAELRECGVHYDY